MKLPKTGNKAVLINRLIQAVQNIDTDPPTPDISLVPTIPSCSQEILQPSSALIPFKATERFTDPSGNNINNKFNYNIEFDRAEFSLTYDHYEHASRS